MRTRRRLLALLVVLSLLAAVGTVVATSIRRPEPAAPPERPFVPLEAIAASHRGWDVVAPPQLPGPYRLSPRGGSLLGAGNGGSMTNRVRNDSGAVTEEVLLKCDPAFDQLVVFLDTAGGDRTLVVMRRAK
ncbi:hypothetical protein R5W24_002110 [Gemmata sp. JC717]|uniref:hypothetical protein n=1 Tax=Gemmata algarum TaxID=2975278 RepID=UPI0021BA7FAE|nr:hypothetical protein [Gemmata algarum]MDY3553020.1 hypothetical protein [Gemmata algarum]